MQTRIYRRLLLGLALLALFVASRPAHAQGITETVLYSFCSQGGSSCTDGNDPLGVVQGTDGNFYGTTDEDGANTYGTVFKMTPSGALTTLYNFCSLADCDDGQGPNAGLIQGSDGNFYGTTSAGGVYGGAGTVFKMTPAGALETIYSFCQSTCTDGRAPIAGLVQGVNGNFYGTTELGGAEAGMGINTGTVFEITPAGALTTLYSFCPKTNCPDGSQPRANLLQGSDGNFYGTTQTGGANGSGTIFKITPSGALTTLYSFCSQSGQTSCTDGYNSPGLTLGPNGDLYGVTPYGGTNSGSFGTIFQITSSGTFTTLYSFCAQSGCPDGRFPYASLLLGADGNFYGTTEEGGAGYGTVFKFTPSGSLTTLYSFCAQGSTSCTDGQVPNSALTQVANGNLYGTTLAGGANGDGTAFEIIFSANQVSSTSVTASPNPATAGQTITLTATVSGSQGVPTGTVTFSANGTTAGSAMLNASGVATLSLSTVGYAAGTYSIVAAYAGNTVYKSSQSSAINLVLNKASSSIGLTASPNPVQATQAETLTATVSGGDGTATGIVNFTVNGTKVGSAALGSSGTTGLTAYTNGLALGTYPVVATYTGSSSYNSSASSAVNVVIEKCITATTVTGAPNPVTPPASVTLIASVRRTASGTTGVPTGTVTFYYGTAALGTITLNESAEASITAPTKGLAAGTYPITVKYNGDADDATSTSAPLYVTVN